jgi:hypothetical protein
MESRRVQRRASACKTHRRGYAHRSNAAQSRTSARTASSHRDEGYAWAMNSRRHGTLAA